MIGKPNIPSSPAFPIFDSKDLIGVEIDKVDAKLNWPVMKSAMTSPSLASLAARWTRVLISAVKRRDRKILPP